MSFKIVAPVFLALLIGFAAGFFLEPAITGTPPPARSTPPPKVSARIFVVHFELPDPVNSDGSLKFDLSDPEASADKNQCEATGGTVTIANGTANYAIPKGDDAKGSFEVELKLFTASRTAASVHYANVFFTPKTPVPPAQEYAGEGTTQSPTLDDAAGGEIIETCKV
jgi:hypothetical protein